MYKNNPFLSPFGEKVKKFEPFSKFLNRMSSIYKYEEKWRVDTNIIIVRTVLLINQKNTSAGIIGTLQKGRNAPKRK